MKNDFHQIWKDANSAQIKSNLKEAISLYESALKLCNEKHRNHLNTTIRILKKRIAIESCKSPDQEKPTAEEQEVINAIKNYFDKEFYKNTYKEISFANLEPILHFVRIGWKEGKNPSQNFSTKHYLNIYSDVKNANINPYWHFIVAGQYENREPMHPGGFLAENLLETKTITEIAKDWKKTEDCQKKIGINDLYNLLTSKNKNRLILSAGHDNYKRISGGIQLCIQKEEEIATRKNFLYLNFHPWQPLPILANLHTDPDPVVSIILNGTEIGNCNSSTLISAIAKLKQEASQKININTIIHSLLGHSPEKITELINIDKDGKHVFWLHDFFSLCPSFTLQRNNYSFCGAPSIDSNSCQICMYGDERKTHTERIRGVLNSNITIVTPSEVTRNFWLKKINLKSMEVQVLPHTEIKLTTSKINTPPTNQLCEQAINIAFLGATAPHKGWPVFHRIFQKLRHENHIRFFYFGNSNPSVEGLTCISTHVTAENPNVMVENLRNFDIDYVIHWTSWPETFSFTAYETIASGAKILTNKNSGNVASSLRNFNAGEILEDENELFRFLSNLNALDKKRLQDYKSAHFRSIQHSDLSFSLI